MKRINDVPGTPQDAAAESERTAAQPSSCASAVELAAVLLAHTMQEAESPISQLSEALARVASNLGAPAQARRDAATGHGLDGRETISRDLALCIENLQFHDRLMQQLARVHAILAALAANRQLADIPAHSPAASAKSGRGSIELF